MDENSINSLTEMSNAIKNSTLKTAQNKDELLVIFDGFIVIRE